MIEASSPDDGGDPIAPIDPTDAPDAGDPTIDGECMQACELVLECKPETSKIECRQGCLDSALVVNNGPIHCMALRIFWIDEEGCGSIVEAYQSFDPADDCSE